MNILLEEGLPEEYEGVTLSTDFRNMLRAEMLLKDSSVPENMRAFLVLEQLYEKLPDDIDTAVEGFYWFFSMGEHDTDESADKPQAKPNKAIVDFEQDDKLIYSAFYSAYGVSLTTVDYMHWWEFLALFEGLPETTAIKKVMYWRGVEEKDMKHMSKEEKAHIRKMKKVFAINKANTARPKTAKEAEQQTLDWAKKIFADMEEKQSAVTEPTSDISTEGKDGEAQ